MFHQLAMTTFALVALSTSFLHSGPGRGGAVLAKEADSEDAQRAPDVGRSPAASSDATMTWGPFGADLADASGTDDQVAFATIEIESSLDSQLDEEAPAGDEVARLAESLRGLPYRWAGSSPLTGFDCSGLVLYVYGQFGVTLGRDSFAQSYAGRAVARAELERGDIVLFSDTYARGVSHVGIYVGDDLFVHSISPRSGVQVSSLSDPYYFAPRFAGARRILE